MLELYVKFHDEAEKNDSLNDEARAWFRKIEDGDAEALSIFNRFKELTLKEVGKVYDLLGVHFDSYAGESFYNDKMQPVVDELKEKNLLEFSEGAYIVRLGEEMPPCVILKSDGATLYSTRDLSRRVLPQKNIRFFINACTSWRTSRTCTSSRFSRSWSSWATIGRRTLSTWRSAWYRWRTARFPHARARSCSCRTCWTRPWRRRAPSSREKSPGLESKDDVAKTVGVGAVVFDALSSARIKDIVFSFDRVLNFDGETGPYVQYTHARCASLLRRADADWGGRRAGLRRAGQR